MNLRCSNRLILLGCGCLLPGFVLLSALKVSATPLPIQPLGQVTAKPTPQSNSLPWLLGGSAIAVGGGLMGLYKLGQRTGRQDANLDRAMAGYRTLVDIEALPIDEPLRERQEVVDPDLAAAAAAVFHSVTDAEENLPAAQQVFPIATETPAIVGLVSDLTVDVTAPFPATDEPVMAIPVPPLPIDPAIMVPPVPTRPIVYETSGYETSGYETSVARVERPQPVAAPPIIPQPVIPQSVVSQPVIPQPVIPQPITPQPVIADPKPAPLDSAIVTTQTPTPTGAMTTSARSTPIQGELVQPGAIAPVAPGGLVEARTRLPQVTVVENFLTDLRSTDAERRKKAIWNLGQCGDSRAVQPLVDLMLDADSRQRSLILSALSEIGVRTLKPMSRALAISLQDENPEVRKNAIRDMTRVYDLIAQISQLVYRATEDPDEDVRDTANWAMKQLNRMRPAESPSLKKSVSPPESLPS
jgi:HEAT repeats